MSFVFVIYIFYISINLIYSYLSLEGYWEAIKLENGNFMIISKSCIYILDPAFQILNKTTDVIIDDYDYTTIKQFTIGDESYILIITEYDHYFLNSDGNLLYTYEDDLFSPAYKMNISVIPYIHSKNEIYYYIIYIEKYTNQISCNKYLIYDDDPDIFYYNSTYEIKNYFITCQLMKYSNENVISCFFPTSIKNDNFINCIVFKLEKNFQIIKTSKLKIPNSFLYGLKSEVISTNDRQKVLIVFCQGNNQFLYYVGYDINFSNFTYGYLRNYYGYYYNHSYLSYDISYFKETE